MPTWNEINLEISQNASANACDEVRAKYLARLQKNTDRTTIAYYSGFLQKRASDGRAHPESAITDLDMNGLMAVVHNVDRTRGLDLLLHTPGGGTEATRAIVEYLYKMFGKDIRTIVPHMAMSAGTMIACASKQIILGKHSALGPTDPQVRGTPAMGVLAEVEKAIEDIKKEPLKQFIYQQIFAKYPPAFVTDCERSVDGSRDMVTTWLAENMLSGGSASEGEAKKVVTRLMDYRGTTEHGHHFLSDKCREMGLNVLQMEDDQQLQEDVLSVHHAFVATFTQTSAIKVIENADGANWIINA